VRYAGNANSLAVARIGLFRPTGLQTFRSGLQTPTGFVCNPTRAQVAVGDSQPNNISNVCIKNRKASDKKTTQPRAGLDGLCWRLLLGYEKHKCWVTKSVQANRRGFHGIKVTAAELWERRPRRDQSPGCSNRVVGDAPTGSGGWR